MITASTAIDGRNMLETVTDHSKHLVKKGLHWSRLGLLVLLGVLLLGGSTPASAAASEAPEATTTEGLSSGEDQQPTGEGQQPTGEGPRQTGEVASGGETAPPADEPLPPVEESAPAPVEEQIAPVVESPPPVEEQIAPVVESPPPVEEAHPVAEPPPVSEVEVTAEPVLAPEETREQVPRTAATEETSSGGGSSSSVALSTSSSEPPSSEGLLAVAGTPVAPVPVETGQTLSLGEADGARHGRLASFGQVGAFGCELSGLGSPMTQNCGGGAVLANPVGGLAVVGSSSISVGASAVHASGEQGGTAIDNRPLSLPTGGSAPSGAAGGSSGAGAGLGFSAFLTLAGLLLLAAPHAMRRLRLSCLPRRTSFFVLIPERPG
jgi:hypothetical protein